MTQILHPVPLDKTGLVSQILHSACSFVQDDRTPFFLHPHTSIPTSAQRNLILRFEWQLPCTHLGFSPDICAEEPHPTL